MAQKQLTASVRLNTKQAEQKLRNIARAIDALNKSVGSQNSTYEKVNKALGKSEQTTKKVKTATDQWANSQKKVNANLKSNNSVLNGVWKKVRGIAATYLGIMGGRAVVDATDTLTGAQNRMNYVNGGNTALTQESLDKMYSSSQKVRTSYQDMMSNVSRNMTLAGDAFDNNIDYAIRFQEIMSEAYAVGGASAAEMSSSMYQLTQALGSGILQGDELRSVREGAPLAYKAIEEFAQGVLNTEKSLKDLASEGKITSDMVIAGVMNMGESVDKAFEQTTQTFGQTFDQIKNSALYAFQPVMEQLTDMLNRAVDNGMIQKFEAFFNNVYKVIMIAFRGIEITINWMAENWYWFQYIVYGVIIAIVVYLGILATTAIWTAMTTFWTFLINNPFIIWIMAIAVLVACLVWLLNQCTNFCEFIIQLAWIVAQAILAVLTVVLAVYLATGTLMMGIPVLIGLIIVGIIAILLAVFLQFTGEIIGGALGIWEVIKAACTWIGNAWSNMCNGLASWFWNAIADMLEGVDWLLEGINKIREALGKDAVNIEGLRAKADSHKAKVEENNVDFGSAWDKGYSKGHKIGTNIQDKINGYGEKIKGYLNGDYKLGGENKLSSLDKIGNALGLDFSGMGNFPSHNGVGSNYKPDYDKLLKGIGDDTGSIADSMDLTSEDLEYLRRVAEMEWKKEFTTAEIKVEMNNANTINGESDLDGIVTKLTDKLYEELSAVADGVY